MLGGALTTYAGATLGDGKSAGRALEEAAVAGIGGAGGAWAADLGGKLLRDGLVRAAGKALSGSATRRVDRVAAKALLPWNKYEASPIAALGAGFAAYEASPQSRSSTPGTPMPVRVTDIGNGGCPIEMANLVMPEQLSASVAKLYRELPGYLCGVWRGFGSGTGRAPAVPETPAAIAGPGRSGIDTYPGKVAELDASISEFAALDRELAPLARRSGEISARGREAVTAVIARVDRGAAIGPPPGPAADEYALGQLDVAFAAGQSILDEAKHGNDHLAERIDALTRRLEELGARIESGTARIDDIERRPPIVIAPYRPHRTAPGLAVLGTARPAPTRVMPGPMIPRERPRPVARQAASGMWRTPWSDSAPRPERGTPSMRGLARHPDGHANSRGEQDPPYPWPH